MTTRIKAVAAACLLAVSSCASAETFQSLFSFGLPQGGFPQARLARDADGNFYGTTTQGGQFGFGTVFKMTAAGTLTVLHDFETSSGTDPRGSLVLAGDGNFYGAVANDGPFGQGTIFRITPGGSFTILHAFDGSDGTHPWSTLTLGHDGNLYGTTLANNGTLFRLTLDGDFTQLQSGLPFGQVPVRLLQAVDGTLYGITSGGGSGNQGLVFAIAGDSISVLHEFQGPDGAYPTGGLAQDSAGNLYGTTFFGAANGHGGVFRLSPQGGFDLLHSFDGSDGGEPLGDLTSSGHGTFYGTAADGGDHGEGVVFEIAADGTYTLIHSFNGNEGGSDPEAGPTVGTDGAIYGTTYFDGSLGFGAIYRVDTAGHYDVLVHLQSNGQFPYAGLLEAADGNLYGTTYEGGASNRGTAFKVTLAGTHTLLHSFHDGDGSIPVGGFVQGTDGLLYGTTGFGGSYGFGTAFSLTPDGTLTTLHSFATDEFGATPNAGLTFGADGNLYGTTWQNGGGGRGTVFSLTPSGTFSLLHTFITGEGKETSAPLTLADDGNFYVASFMGGANDMGAILKIAPSGQVTVLHSFNSTDGANPGYGPVVQGSDGAFYGTTENGGGSNLGTVFRVTAAGEFATIHSFSGTDGATPFGGLVASNDGNFYGTTYAGGPDWVPNGSSGWGTLFKITTAGAVTTIHALNYFDGSGPAATMIKASDGNYYGTTLYGGTSGLGSVFRITPGGLEAPANLAAQAGDGYVQLTWSAVPSATSYAVYMSTTQHDSNPTVVTPSISQTLYTVTGLQNGTTYYFTVRATSGSTEGPASSEVAGTPVAPPHPSVTATPNPLDFGSQPVGATSSARSITITNDGNVTVTFSGIVAGGPAATDFAVSGNTCTGSLQPSRTCTLGFTFTPSAAGDRNASETLSTDSALQLVIQVAGTGTQASGSLSPASLDFGQQGVGTSSAARALTLKSTGNAALTISGITVSGNFTQTNNCPIVLAPDAQCEIDVLFSPTVVGAASGAISVSSDGNALGATLAGRGIQAAISVSTPAGFGALVVGTTSAAANVIVTNSGSDTLVVGAPIMGGANTSDFFIVSNNCGNVAPSGNCAIAVKFSPTRAGDRTATLTIPSNAPGAAPTRALSGMGVMPAPVWSGPTPADNTQVTLAAQQSFSQPLEATESVSGAIVHIGASSLPAGANLASIDGNRASATLSWMPAASGDYVITLTATELSTATSAAPRTLRLHVTKLATSIAAKPEILSISPTQIHLRMKATLNAQASGRGVAGRTVVFSAPGGAVLCSAVTDATGVAACGDVTTFVRTTVNLGYVARFAGDVTYEASSATGTLVQ